ncbi:hypothetical protein XENOCAPTIV_028307, partial [Xenoophorus captivus]
VRVRIRSPPISAVPGCDVTVVTALLSCPALCFWRGEPLLPTPRTGHAPSSLRAVCWVFGPDAIVSSCVPVNHISAQVKGHWLVQCQTHKSTHSFLETAQQLHKSTSCFPYLQSYSFLFL